MTIAASLSGALGWSFAALGDVQIRPQQEHRGAVYLAQRRFIQAQDFQRRADLPERDFLRRFLVRTIASPAARNFSYDMAPETTIAVLPI